MAILTITKADGTNVPLPDPSEYSWGLQDVSWPPMKAAPMSTLLQAVDDVFFDVSYPDAMTGTTRKMTAYVGDRTAPMYSLIDGAYQWNGLSMNFIER